MEPERPLLAVVGPRDQVVIDEVEIDLEVSKTQTHLTAVKPVPVGATGAGGNRGDAAQMRERGFPDEALRVGN